MATLEFNIIDTSKIAWYNPAVTPPPFEIKLLLMLSGSISNDFGRTYITYTSVITARIKTTSPNDDYDRRSSFNEFNDGGKVDFLDYQFDLENETGDEFDGFSDSIAAWTYYPYDIEKAAINAGTHGGC